MLCFQWDEKKARSNKKKHGVSFEEARSVFFDDNALEFPDPDHSDDEERFLMIGRSFNLRILVVCHCFRVGESEIRIISARKGTKKERGVYADRRRFK